MPETNFEDQGTLKNSWREKSLMSDSTQIFSNILRGNEIEARLRHHKQNRENWGKLVLVSAVTTVQQSGNLNRA